MKHYENCPVCNNTAFSEHLTCKDFTVSNETFSIVKCNGCNFTFTNPIPLESEIGSYYESEDYISHSNTRKGIVNSLYQIVRNYTLDKKVALLRKLNDGFQLLDIGSGTGEFLNHCKKNGFEVSGVEPSKIARESANQNFNLSVKEESSLAHFENNSFDFITMWHVLEHVYHLNDRVNELKRLIKQEGHIIVAVPNYHSWDAKKYKENWAAYDVPRHLYHFTPDTIKELFLKHGLKLIDTLPMKFDSFYVSLLSEKYKTGNTNLISAFISGLKSNIKAKPTKTYSSQIYIFKK